LIPSSRATARCYCNPFLAGLRLALARIRALIKSIFGGASPRQKYFSRSERAIAGARTGNRALSEAPVTIARASGSGRRTQLARNARRHFGQLIRPVNSAS